MEWTQGRQWRPGKRVEQENLYKRQVEHKNHFLSHIRAASLAELPLPRPSVVGTLPFSTTLQEMIAASLTAHATIEKYLFFI